MLMELEIHDGRFTNTTAKIADGAITSKIKLK